MATNNISPFGGFLFLMGELVASILGSYTALYIVGRASFRGSLHLQEGYSVKQGFVGEMLATAILVSVAML
jgi:hypothetical protein